MSQDGFLTFTICGQQIELPLRRCEAFGCRIETFAPMTNGVTSGHFCSDHWAHIRRESGGNVMEMMAVADRIRSASK